MTKKTLMYFELLTVHLMSCDVDPHGNNILYSSVCNSLLHRPTFIISCDMDTFGLAPDYFVHCITYHFRTWS